MFKFFASPSALLLLACSEATATGKIAVIGGANSGPSLDSIEILAQADTQTLWVKQANTLAAVKQSVGAAFLDGTLYAIGGSVGNQEVNSVDTLDTTTEGGVWSVGPTLLKARFSHGAAAHDGVVYAIGGLKKIEWVPQQWTVEMLDTRVASPAWVYGPPLMNRRGTTAAVAVDGKLYVIGGSVQTSSGSISTSGTVEVLDTSVSGGAWVAGKTLQIARFAHAAATYAGKIYVTGGVTGIFGVTDEWPAHDLEILNTRDSSAEWTSGPQLKIRRQIHASAFSGGMLCVMGGQTRSTGIGDHSTRNVEMLDIASGATAWVDGKDLVDKRKYVTAAALTVPAATGSPANTDCVVTWEPCNTACLRSRTITTAQSGTGEVCLQTDPGAACANGDGTCVKGTWIVAEPTNCATTCGTAEGSGSAGTVTCPDTICDGTEPSAKECAATAACAGTVVANTNCISDWGACGVSCVRPVVIATPQSGTGDPCLAEDAPQSICYKTSGDCVVDVDVTEESVTTAATAIAGTFVEFSVVDNSVTVEPVGEDLIVEITLRGDLSEVTDSIKEDFKTKLAESLGVPKSWIKLSFTAGSIVVTATVHNPDAATVANTDCVGTWQPCNTNCLRLYDTTTEQSGTGSACPQTDPEPTCVDGEGTCVIGEDDVNSQFSVASHANLSMVFFMVVMTSLQLVCY